MLSAFCFAQSNSQHMKIKDGPWRAVLKITDDIELPFNFSVDKNGKITIFYAVLGKFHFF